MGSSAKKPPALHCAGGFWSEWRGSNSRPRGPKPRVLSAELHPDIHFSAIIPRRGRKSKIFLSVVICVVKAAFVPFSATGESPANTGVARLCGISPCLVSDTATALPNQARYQLRYTRILNDSMGMAPPEQRADAHCTRYPCIITHRRQKGKRILIRFFFGRGLICTWTGWIN